MRYLNKIIEYGIYFLIFLLPWQTRWIIKAGEMEYTTYSLYGTDILLIILILLFLFFKFQIPNSKFQINSQIQIPKSWYFIGLFDLFIFVSIFFASDKWLALYKYGWFLLGVGLFWLITSTNYNKIKLLWFLLAGIFLQACLGIWQFLSQSSFAFKWLGLALHNPAELGTSVVETFGADGLGERWLRAYGGLDHPNVLGGILVIGLLLVVSFVVLKSKCQNPNVKSNPNAKIQNVFVFLPARQPARLQARIADGCHLPASLCPPETTSCRAGEARRAGALAGGCFCVFVMSLFFTFSRGAWAGAIAGILVMLFIFLAKKDFLRQKELLKMILAAGILIFVLFNFYGDLVLTRLSKDTRLEIKSNTERMESFKEARSLIKNNWLFGAGVGNYTLALVQDNPGQSSWSYQPVHNVFLLIWAETGILGLLGFLGFLGYLGWSLIKKGKYFGLSILAALIIIMMVDHWYWSLHFGVLWFWLVIGMMVENNCKI